MMSDKIFFATNLFCFHYLSSVTPMSKIYRVNIVRKIEVDMIEQEKAFKSIYTYIIFYQKKYQFKKKMRKFITQFKTLKKLNLFYNFQQKCKA